MALQSLAWGRRGTRPSPGSLAVSRELLAEPPLPRKDALGEGSGESPLVPETPSLEPWRPPGPCELADLP